MKNILILFIICGPFFISAQGVLKGVIEDAKTHQPIPDVYIQTPDNRIFLSGEDGYFEIPADRPSTVLTFMHQSFLQKVQTCEAERELRITMEESPVLLHTILVRRNPLLDDQVDGVLNERLRAGSFAGTTKDLFRNVPGFSLVKRSGFASEPVFRGFREDRLNVMYDGGVKIMHACPNRMDPISTHVMPEEIEKIEVIKGPFSVLYGPNFGGTINIITSPVSAAVHPGWHGVFLSGGATNAPAFISRGKLGYAKGKVAFGMTGSVLKYGDYLTGPIDGKKDTVPAHFKTYAFSLHTSYRPSNTDVLQVNLRKSIGLDIAHAGLPMDSKHNNSIIGEANYSREFEKGTISYLKIQIYRSYVDHLMSNTKRPNARMVDAHTQVYATTTGGKIQTAFRLAKGWTLDAGVDLTDVVRTGLRQRLVKRLPPDHPKNPGKVLDVPKSVTDTIWPDAEQTIFGAFVQLAWVPGSRWSLVSGVRTDYFSSKAGALPGSFTQQEKHNADRHSYSHYSGHINAKFRAAPQAILHVSVGRGTRFPSMEEQYIQHLAVGAEPYEYVGNPDIRPELNNEIEMGVKWVYSKFRLYLNAYYSRISDYILPVVDTSLKRKFLPWREPRVAKSFVNIEAASISGLEARTRLMLLQGLSLELGLTATKGQNLSGDTPLPLIPPLRVNMAMRYENNGYFVEIQGLHSTKQERISKSFGETITPAYSTVDVKAGWRPGTHWVFKFSVNNVLDAAYYDHLNFSYKNNSGLKGRIYEPGRSFSTSLKYSF